MTTVVEKPNSKYNIRSQSETILVPHLPQRLSHPKNFSSGDSLSHYVEHRRQPGSKLLFICKMLFLLSVLYTALGHFLDQKGLWDPCIGQITYKKSFTTESYLGGRALRCSIKEDYFCLVPGYSGAQVSTGWTFGGRRCDESVVTTEATF